MPAERERDHGGTLREHPRRPPDVRPFQIAREPVRDHDHRAAGEARSGVVGGLDRDPVPRAQHHTA
ncbi:hypothetical protein ACFQ0Q_20020 [Streptomyces aureus]